MSKVKREGILLCLIGPAGGGKSTFSRELLKVFKGSTKLSVSVTSRNPRKGEREGVAYYFVSKAQFKNKISRGEFFEWEQVHGNYYGTLKSTVEQSIKSSIDLLLDIDIKGALNFKKQYRNNTVVIFLAPPSFNVMLKRIKGRSNVSIAELARRVKTAREEYKALLSAVKKSGAIDYFVVNDKYEHTLDAVVSVLKCERHRISRLEKNSLKNICKVGNV